MMAASSSRSSADRRALSRPQADPRPLRPQPVGQDDEAFIHLDEMTALAKLPNVAVKMTGAPHYSTQPYPFRNIQDGLQHLRCLRARPLFLGHRHHPHALLLAPVRDLLHRGTAWLKGKDLENVMGRGVCQFLGWKLPGV